MKRIPLAQLRDMLNQIKLQDEKTLLQPYGWMKAETRVEARARYELIEAIEQAFEGDTALLQTYLLSD